MKKLFQPSDFGDKPIFLPQEAADKANEIIEKLVAEAEVVYKQPGMGLFGGTWTAFPPSGGTYKKGAVLFVEDVEKKECCVHTPSLKHPAQSFPFVGQDLYAAADLLGSSVVCSVCGVELKASWSKK